MTPGTFGQRLADRCSRIIGSWRFIGLQTSALTLWILLNSCAKGPDPYPFILLNLLLSFQAAYTGPVLLMAANRQSEIDRKRAIQNLEIDQIDHEHILALAKHIDEHFDGLNDRLSKMAPAPEGTRATDDDDDQAVKSIS